MTSLRTPAAGAAGRAAALAARRAPSRAPRRVGDGTMAFPTRPRIVSAATVAGEMEGEGPLGRLFDEVSRDSLFGRPSWELGEIEMMRRAAARALEKASARPEDVDLLFGGDLLNQIVATNFAAREMGVATFGLFSACATFTSALALAGMSLDGGHARRVMVGVSSHHDTAERQYRLPTELGFQRPQTAQWTATAAAAYVLEAGSGDGADGAAGGAADPADRAAASVPRAADGTPDGGEAPVVALATPGRVVDLGVKDPYDMGSAMAPAAADTIERHLRDTGRDPSDYDVILTGDLAAVGTELVRQLLRTRGIDVAPVHEDCALLLFDRKRQDVHAGASGAACSGAVFAAHFLPRLRSGELGRVLLVATGALLSPTTYQQGQTIPCVAHAVVVESARGRTG